MRETEVKKAIQPEQIESLRDLATSNGYKFEGSWNHIDIAFDTEDSLLKGGDVIFRVRRVVTGTKEEVFLTLKSKIPQAGTQILDNHEYEVCLSADQFREDVFEVIRKRLFLKSDGILLAPESLQNKGLEAICLYLKRLGLGKLRLALEKDRTQFGRGGSKICFDTLLGGAGSFMEIEENDRQALSSTMSIMGIQPEDAVDGNYGKIAKRFTASTGQAHPEVCVSDDTGAWLLPILDQEVPVAEIPDNRPKNVVVCVVGQVASGKSTAVEVSKTIFDNNEVPYGAVDKLELYGDFFEEFRIENPNATSRNSLGQFFKTVYEREGDDIGTRLLEFHIMMSGSDDIYLIDGKRSPAGIRRFKEKFPNGVLVEVNAPQDLRTERFTARQKAMDRGLDLASLDRRMAQTFGGDDLEAYYDFVIENGDFEQFKRDVFKVLQKALGNETIINDAGDFSL